MTDAPERIWASYRKQPEQLYAYPWPSHEGAAEYQYILATPEALAASPEVQALVREVEALLQTAIDLLNEPVATHRNEDWLARRHAFNEAAAILEEPK